MRVCSVCGRCFSSSVEICPDASHPALTEVAGREVDIVPGYRIERLIERESTRDRYTAVEKDSGSKCVINFVSLSRTTPDSFLNDAKKAATIFHPNIANIYGSGVLENGDAYFIGERAPGRSLRNLLNEGIPPLLTTIRIVREIAEATHALNTNGVTHGAIRPENVLLADSPAQNSVKLQNPDLGGTIRNSIISNKLTIDSAIGNIRYFAPEQFSADRTTPHTDVYALGVLLFEMLTGGPPFDGENAAELVERIKNDHAPEARIDNFDLRMLLTHTLMQSQQKQPAFRQPTALAFARQMRHIEQLATHSTTPPVPFPAAIPQKRAAATAAAGSSSVQSTATRPNRRKTIEITDVKKLDLKKPIERAQPPARPPVQRTVEETVSVRPPENRTQAESTGDLNRSRLQSWRAKYQSVASAFQPENKDSIQQLSLTDPTPPEARIVDASRARPGASLMVPPPTPTKIELDEPIDDVPSFEQARKMQVQDSPLRSESVGEEAKVAEVRVRPEAQLFASYEKRPRIRRKPLQNEAGVLSSIAASLSAFSMRNWMIAGASLALVIAAVLAGNALLGGDQAGSPNEEKAEAKPASVIVERAPTSIQENASVINEADEGDEVPVPAFEQPKVSSVRSFEDAPRSVAPKQQPPAKSSVPDAVQNAKPKPSAAVQTQTASSSPAKATPKPALTPSTLVISPGNGKVKSKVEPGSGSAFTRPRIVANPKP